MSNERKEVVMSTKARKTCLAIITEQILKWLYSEGNISEIEYLKAKLGIESILLNISKFFIIYACAIRFQTLIPTVITHLAYVSLRKFSQGLHAKSSLVCTIVSLFMFVAIPYMAQDVIINRWLIFLAFVVSTYLFWKYAPADTEKSPILGVKNRLELKLYTIGINVLLMYVALTLIMPMFRTLITIGMLMQVIMVLPITYKILGRSYKNYEKYETED